MTRKKEAEKLVTVQAAVPVIIWRANRPLNETQHDDLVRKLKAEEKRTGVEILLVPYSVDVEVAAELKEQQPDNNESEAGAGENDE